GRPVDAAVDAREAGGDLVDGAVEVVDPRLQRDGEVDEILPAAPDERALRLAEPTDTHPGPPGDRDADGREHHTYHCDDERGCGRDVHAPRVAPCPGLPEGEDDGVARLVVGGVVLARNRRDVHVDGRL